MAESQGKIIVIDDEILIIKRLEALLIPRHYEVISASNGEAALKLVLQEQPDLILLDVLMPGMNGFEVCRQLKDDPVTRLIPVVLMTALGEVEDRVKGLEAGADDFLTKPVNRDELLARIQSSLRLKRTIDQKVDSLQSIQNYLSKFVPQSIKRLIQVDPERLEQDKREQDVSVLFVDISGYARQPGRRQWGPLDLHGFGIGNQCGGSYHRAWPRRRYLRWAGNRPAYRGAFCVATTRSQAVEKYPGGGDDLPGHGDR